MLLSMGYSVTEALWQPHNTADAIASHTKKGIRAVLIEYLLIVEHGL